MGAGKRNYSAIALIVAGIAILVGSLLFFGWDLSTIPFYLSLGSALIMSGIIFSFVRFQAERRYYASCMLSCGLFAFLITLVFNMLYSPTDFLRFSMGWFYGFIFLIVGGLFWFLEPKGRGMGWVGADCSGCESCGPWLLLFIALSLCGIAYILETAGTDPLGLAFVAMLMIGALLHLARVTRK